MKLLMLLLGCKPDGRHTEQHDVLFTIAENLAAAIPDIKSFWPDAGVIHVDAWREISALEGFDISVQLKEKISPDDNHSNQLFFLNLGGYKKDEFEEFHYKMLAVAENKSVAIKQAKATAFYKHTGFKGAASHIDDKYGVDVDDVYEIKEILPERIRNKYSLKIKPTKGNVPDAWHLGYLPMSKIKK